MRGYQSGAEGAADGKPTFSREIEMVRGSSFCFPAPTPLISCNTVSRVTSRIEVCNEERSCGE